MVFMTAVRNDGIDAAVWYHGADTDKYLGDVDGLHAPILMHLAEEDEFIPKAAQAELRAYLLRRMHCCAPNTAQRSRYQNHLSLFHVCRKAHKLVSREGNQRDRGRVRQVQLTVELIKTMLFDFRLTSLQTLPASPALATG